MKKLLLTLIVMLVFGLFPIVTVANETINYSQENGTADRSMEIEARAIAWMFLEKKASEANVVFKRTWTPATSERQFDGTYLVEGKCTINDVKKRYRVKVKPQGGGNWSLEDLQILPL